MKLVVAIAILIIGPLSIVSAQAPQKKNAAAPVVDNQAVRSSAAFAEVILRRAELEADLESLLMEFTDEYPKVKENRYTLSQLQKQIDRLLATKPAEVSKLTLALGKLMVKKAELDTDLWSLQEGLADGHPDVKRAKRKVEIFEKAIKEILG
ncbi:MAG: hypothetical protein ABI791_08500 [Acidobacteriota bacterium]